MDFATADRYDFSNLVWFNRQAFETDSSTSSFEMKSKTTDDVWLELKEELQLDRNDVHRHDQGNSPLNTSVTSSEWTSSPDDDEEQLIFDMDVDEDNDDFLPVSTHGTYKFFTLPPISCPLSSITPTTSMTSSESTSSSPDDDEEQLIFDMDDDDFMPASTHGSDKFFTLPPIISPAPTPVFSFQSHPVMDPAPSTTSTLCSRIPSTSTDGGYGSDEDSDNQLDDGTSSLISTPIRPIPNQTCPQRPCRSRLHRSRPSGAHKCVRQLFP
ncbi:uncharacterized protein [Amphiura filiformis]|uniref:uncharacterized protein n=1 Tax=Amphiura filiformis TaxID=82378 RepID=UPI003B20BC8C